MRQFIAVLGACLTLAGVEGNSADFDDIIVTDGPDARLERTAVVRALQMLGRHPWRLAIIDAEAARPEVRARLRSLDAFTTSGGRVVYVLRHSAALQGAISASRTHTLALASIIWHEMAHIDGGDERKARRAEEDLWRQFIRDGEVDHVVALRYLSALRSRTNDETFALR
jgi:Zn-dependent protease with chaperone function